MGAMRVLGMSCAELPTALVPPSCHPPPPLNMKSFSVFWKEVRGKQFSNDTEMYLRSQDMQHLNASPGIVLDPLVEIPFSEWPKLLDLYDNDLDGAVAYGLLNTHMSYPDFIERYNFKVFSPFGDISNGMVAVSNKYGFRQVAIHPLDVSKMEEALLRTSAFDWDANVISSASPRVEECLNNLCKHLPIQIIGAEKAYKHFLRKSAEPYKNVSCPSHTYVDQLKPEHIEIVDITWTYHSDTSHKYFNDLMNNGLTYVLYSDRDQPLAWVTMGSLGALTHLYCSEEYRGKGYAEFIMKYVVNDQLSKGNHVLAYTVEDNVKAKNLFDKLGFERAGCDKWIFIKKTY